MLWLSTFFQKMANGHKTTENLVNNTTTVPEQKTNYRTQNNNLDSAAYVILAFSGLAAAYFIIQKPNSN